MQEASLRTKPKNESKGGQKQSNLPIKHFRRASFPWLNIPSTLPPSCSGQGRTEESRYLRSLMLGMTRLPSFFLMENMLEPDFDDDSSMAVRPCESWIQSLQQSMPDTPGPSIATLRKPASESNKTSLRDSLKTTRLYFLD